MDSGFHFWLMELGFWIQIVNRIPEFRTPEEKNSRIPECDPFTWGKMRGEFIERQCLHFCSIISVYVVVNFLSQVIFLFLSFQLH